MRLDQLAQLLGDIDRHVVKRHAVRSVPAPSARWHGLAHRCRACAEAHCKFAVSTHDGERRKAGVILAAVGSDRASFIEQYSAGARATRPPRWPVWTRTRRDPRSRAEGDPADRRDAARASARTTARPSLRAPLVSTSAARSRASDCSWRPETVKPRKFGRDFRQLMRLVDDDRIRAGQQIAEALLLQHEIRHQQMMIDDDDVRGLRLAPRLHDVTAIERRAIRPEAVVARRGHPGPHRICSAQLGEFGDVAAAGDARPRPHLRQCGGDLATQSARVRLLLGEFQSMQAQIVRAPLQQRDAHRAADRRGDGRQIAMKQLVLQRARAGRHDDASPRQQRRHQIRERLAGACSRFDDQPPARIAARARQRPPCDLFLRAWRSPESRAPADRPRHQRSSSKIRACALPEHRAKARERDRAGRERIAAAASGCACSRSGSTRLPTTFRLARLRRLLSGANVWPPSTEKVISAPGPPPNRAHRWCSREFAARHGHLAERHGRRIAMRTV